jgi:predicted TIM-barrel fold metal-dependent hydrolase
LGDITPFTVTRDFQLRTIAESTRFFDPIDPKTPARIEELVHSLTGRIVGIRIHEFHSPQTPPTTTGPMRDRDMRSAGMKNTWRKMRDLGLGIEMQSIPYYAPQVRALAEEFPEIPVQMDHFGLPTYGDQVQYEESPPRDSGVSTPHTRPSDALGEAP